MDVTKLYDRAKAALDRANYDYAIDIFRQILRLEPKHLESRQGLREAQRRKLQQAGMPSSVKYLCWIKGLPSLIRIPFFMITKNYDGIIEACEGILAHNPDCRPICFLLGKTCGKADYTQTAIWVLEELRKAKPDDVKVLRYLAEFYRRRNDVENATECLQEILRLVPHDREAEQDLRDVAAIKTMIQGRWTEAGKEGGYRKMLKNEQQAQELETAQSDLRTTDDVMRNIERVKRDLEREPRNKRFWLQLGDLYRTIRQFDQARNAYNKALEIDALDFSAVEKLGDLRILEFDTEIEKIAEQLKQNPNNQAAKQRHEQLTRERLEFSASDYEKRVKNRPTDLPLRFKYGEILFELGKIREAAQHYQLAVNDPRNRRKACYKLGLCFIQLGLQDSAIGQLEKAVAGMPATSSEAKEYLYVLADTYEKVGDIEKAHETFKRIVDVDLTYRDATQRVDKLLKKKREQA